MARYMLDTDTCSYIMKRSSEAVLKRLRAVPVTDVCMSVITKSELLYGVEVSPRRAQDATALHAFLPHVAVLEFPDDDRRQRSLHCRSRPQPRAQAGDAQHRRIQSCQRSDARKLDDASSSSCPRKRR